MEEITEKKILKSAKGVDRDTRKREYITGDYNSVLDFLYSRLIKAIAESGNVTERTAGRRQEREEYREGYFKNYKLKPTIKKKLNDSMEKLMKAYNGMVWQLADQYIDKLTPKKDKDGNELPVVVNITDVERVAKLVAPLLGIEDPDNAKKTDPNEKLAHLRRAIARTESVMKKHSGQKAGGTWLQNKGSDDSLGPGI